MEYLQGFGETNGISALKIANAEIVHLLHVGEDVLEEGFIKRTRRRHRRPSGSSITFLRAKGKPSWPHC